MFGEARRDEARRSLTRKSLTDEQIINKRRSQGSAVTQGEDAGVMQGESRDSGVSRDSEWAPPQVQVLAPPIETDQQAPKMFSIHSEEQQALLEEAELEQEVQLKPPRSSKKDIKFVIGVQISCALFMILGGSLMITQIDWNCGQEQQVAVWNITMGALLVAISILLTIAPMMHNKTVSAILMWIVIAMHMFMIALCFGGFVWNLYNVLHHGTGGYDSLARSASTALTKAYPEGWVAIGIGGGNVTIFCVGAGAAAIAEIVLFGFGFYFVGVTRKFLNNLDEASMSTLTQQPQYQLRQTV